MPHNRGRGRGGSPSLSVSRGRGAVISGSPQKVLALIANPSKSSMKQNSVQQTNNVATSSTITSQIAQNQSTLQTVRGSHQNDSNINSTKIDPTRPDRGLTPQKEVKIKVTITHLMYNKYKSIGIYFLFEVS